MKKIQEIDLLLEPQDNDTRRVFAPIGADFIRARLINGDGVVYRMKIYALVETDRTLKEKVSFRLIYGDQPFEDTWTWFDTVFVKGEPVHVVYTQGFWGQ